MSTFVIRLPRDISRAEMLEVVEAACMELATEHVLREMEREWRQLQSRYGHFQEFVDMVRGDVEAA